MSAASTNCNCACPDPVVVEIPGVEGASGDPGLNAFTETTGDFIVPAIGANVTILVETSLWMAVGQPVFVEGAGTFEVISKPSTGSFVGEYLDYSTNTETGNLIATGADVSPGGQQPSSAVATIGVVDPEGVVSAGPGTFYINSTGPTLWVKMSGTATVGWLQMV